MDLEGRATVEYAHPTIRDAIAEITAAEPEWLDIFLQGSDIEHILEETTAGSTGAYGVRIHIPEARFESFADRLAEGRKTMQHDRDQVYSYLAYRTSDGFLRSAAQRRPELFEENTYYNYSDSGDDVFLVVAGRLAQSGGLTPAVREKAMKRMLDYASESLTFLDVEVVRAMLTDAEYAHILALVSQDVEENLSDFRYNIRSNYSRSWGTPEDAFSRFFGDRFDLRGNSGTTSVPGNEKTAV